MRWPQSLTAEAESDPPSGRRLGFLGLGVALAIAYLVVALGSLSSYGATWDCVMGEYPYGERLLEYGLTGDEAFLTLESYEPEPTRRQPHPNFDTVRLEWMRVYPFAGILSAISCRVLWTELGIVPALEAHNLVIPLMVAALVALMVWIVAPRQGPLAAAAAVVFLVASPRFFAHSMNNLKDAPETCLYVGATLLGYIALTGGGLRWWIGSGALTGFALAQKPNALFVPPQFGLFLLLVALVPAFRRTGTVRWSWRGFLLGTLVLVLAHYSVSPRYWTEPIEGPTARIAEMMRLGNQAFDEGALAEVRGTAETEPTVPLYAPLFVATTTPPILLLLGLVGLFSRRLRGPLGAFVWSGLAVTIGRNMLPGVRNFDGIRHFLEFYPYLAIAAGVGLVALLEGSRRLGRLWNRWLSGALVGACLLAPMVQSVATHPNGVGYFNALVGGLEGAQRRKIPGATDYWANTYLQAIRWINGHAEPGDVLLFPTAGHVAAAMVPTHLRSDLSLWRRDRTAQRGSTYVAYITRPGTYRALMYELEKRREPVHEIRVQGGVLCRIFRLEPGPKSEELLALWERKLGARESTTRILRWLEENPDRAPEAWAIVLSVNRAGFDETLARLKEYFPEELHEGLEGVLWNQLDG